MKNTILILLILITISSCKKKSCEQEILPDKIINPVYDSELTSSLLYNIKNGHIDTILGFGGYIYKKLNGQSSVENFSSITYNSSSVAFDNLPNFMSNAVNSNWNVTSNLVGNFNYIDNRQMPNCLNCGAMTPSVGRFTGLNLNLTGISNADRISVEVNDMTFINPNSNSLDSYDLQGVSTFTTNPYTQFYSNFMSSANVGDDIILTITLDKSKNETLNGILTAFTKSTVYRFPTKIVN